MERNALKCVPIVAVSNSCIYAMRVRVCVCKPPLSVLFLDFNICASEGAGGTKVTDTRSQVQVTWCCEFGRDGAFALLGTLHATVPMRACRGVNVHDVQVGENEFAGKLRCSSFAPANSFVQVLSCEPQAIAFPLLTPLPFTRTSC